MASSGGKPSAQFDFADLTCRGCHKDVHAGQADKYISQGGCEFCHGVESWPKTTFDHARTRFPLEGKHVVLTCGKCHPKEETATGPAIRLTGVAQECAACHADIHRGQFVRSERMETHALCQRCHTAAGWKPLTFDHNRDTRYALDGAHAKVPCATCHKSAAAEDGSTFVIYRPLGWQCVDCHATGTEIRDRP